MMESVGSGISTSSGEISFDLSISSVLSETLASTSLTCGPTAAARVSLVMTHEVVATNAGDNRARVRLEFLTPLP